MFSVLALAIQILANVNVVAQVTSIFCIDFKFHFILQTLQQKKTKKEIFQTTEAVDLAPPPKVSSFMVI